MTSAQFLEFKKTKDTIQKLLFLKLSVLKPFSSKRLSILKDELTLCTHTKPSKADNNSCQFSIFSLKIQVQGTCTSTKYFFFLSCVDNI